MLILTNKSPFENYINKYLIAPSLQQEKNTINQINNFTNFTLIFIRRERFRFIIFVNVEMESIDILYKLMAVINLWIFYWLEFDFIVIYIVYWWAIRVATRIHWRITIIYFFQLPDHYMAIIGLFYICICSVSVVDYSPLMIIFSYNKILLKIWLITASWALKTFFSLILLTVFYYFIIIIIVYSMLLKIYLIFSFSFLLNLCVFV